MIRPLRALPVTLATSIYAMSCGLAQAQTDLGIADDDIWCYDRAGDPAGDPVLRIWGNDGDDLNPTGYPGEGGVGRSFYSYAFLQWDLAGLPDGYRWRGATLILTAEDASSYDPATDEVRVRGLTAPFDESTWSFGRGSKPIYGDTNYLLADDSGYTGAGSEIRVEIPANLPEAVLQKWRTDRKIYLCVTSPIDFDNDGKFLRIASRDNLLFDGPRLILH